MEMGNGYKLGLFFLRNRQHFYQRAPASSLYSDNQLSCIMSIVTGGPRLTALRFFIVLHRYCVFCKLKVCGNPASSKCLGAIFPTAFVHFMSLCHILVILGICQTFFFIMIFVTVICDQ